MLLGHVEKLGTNALAHEDNSALPCPDNGQEKDAVSADRLTFALLLPP